MTRSIEQLSDLVGSQLEIRGMCLEYGPRHAGRGQNQQRNAAQAVVGSEGPDQFRPFADAKALAQDDDVWPRRPTIPLRLAKEGMCLLDTADHIQVRVPALAQHNLLSQQDV